jgi:phage regulator Rha-like protein
MSSKHTYGASNDFVLTVTKAEARIDTRTLALRLGNKHRHSLRLIDKYIPEFKKHGQVSFRNADGEREQGGGKGTRYALLNEDQAYLLLSLSRNTEIVVALKSQLIAAFGAYRRAAEMRQIEYIPAYHQAHDQIKILANGAAGEHFDHMNLNRLLNKVVGIEAGQRGSAPTNKQALLTVGLMLANKAMQGASDSKTGYQRAKQAILPLAALAIKDSSC